MKITALFLLLLFSSFAEAEEKEITDATCRVFLPKPEKQTWGSLRKRFIEKGYEPLELQEEEILQQGKVGDMHAHVHYDMTYTSRWNKDCVFQLELKKFQSIDIKTGTTTSALLFSQRAEEKTVLGQAVSCFAAEEEAFAELPTCHRTATAPAP